MRAGRRLTGVYAALALAAIATTVVVAPTQPEYGGDGPWQGIAVDDLRQQPTTTGWRVDLRAALAPGAPPECLRYRSTPVDQGLALVSAAGAWTYGFANDGDCATPTQGVGTRIGALDVDRGAFRWVHDVADDFHELGLTGPALVSSVSTVEGAGLVLVRASVDGEQVLTTLSTETGRPVDVVSTGSAGDGDQFQTAGAVVVTGRQQGVGGVYRYELRDARDLGRVVWSGAASTAGIALALSDRVVVARADGSVQVDLATGVERAWSARLDRLVGYVVHDDVVYAPRGGAATGRGDAGFVALTAGGERLWSSDRDVRGGYSVTRTCLAVTDVRSRTVTCLDLATGEVRWRDPASSSSAVDGLPGQTDDRVFATATAAGPGPVVVRALDGATGSAGARVSLPDGAVLAAAGRTVGYALAYGSSGGRSTLVAFDLSSGRPLWQHAAQLQVYAWAGRLVDVDVDGVARELVAPDRVAVPPGSAGS
ncbi:hypothetical protein [Frigoribacterium sp. Leaf186]|uniref:hypothetical protein n=1 Tax=Frigoribacterium sp. Leaf186 TaxID=1736293 RepID=UPI0006F603C7|nr:hypothetical protein [Frigoribacterium sp. Leaf186]KQS22625.1 hypothetical protein ASG05_03515 [Frigoribacterium sp. Leaf186]